MSHTPRCLALGACILALPLALVAAPASLEARITRLEEALARIEARLGPVGSADVLRPVATEIRNLRPAPDSAEKRELRPVVVAGTEERLAIGGSIQLTGEAGDAPDARFAGIENRFLVRRARLNVRGHFAEHFDFMVQPEFGNNAIAPATGFRAQLTDLFVTWNQFPEAVLQLGQFKTPFGFEQLVSDAKVVTVERSLPSDRLTVGRQLGFGVSGLLAERRLSYSVGLFNGNGVNNGANDNDQMMSIARASAVLWSGANDSLRVGANAVHSRDTGTFTGVRNGGGVDVQVSHEAFELSAEYLRLDLRRRLGAKTESDGWMAQATWFFVPKIWQGVVRFENFDADRQVPGNVSTSWILGFNYCLKGDDLKLSLNYHLGNPAGPLRDQGRILGRVQVVF